MASSWRIVDEWWREWWWERRRHCNQTAKILLGRLYSLKSSTRTTPVRIEGSHRKKNLVPCFSNSLRQQQKNNASTKILLEINRRSQINEFIDNILTTSLDKFNRYISKHNTTSCITVSFSWSICLQSKTTPTANQQINYRTILVLQANVRSYTKHNHKSLR